MKDIADRAGVSIATVSMVLNKKDSKIAISDERKREIFKIAEELGYKPNYYARALRLQKSDLIGVIVWDLTDQFFSLILKGIESELKKAGCRIILANADEDVNQLCESFSHFEQFRVDGMVILGGGKTSKCEEELQAGFSRPIINIGRYTDSSNEDSVLIDNYSGGREGADYLKSLNKDKIVYIGRKTKTFDEEERLRGFVKEFENGPEYDLLEIESSTSAAYKYASAYLAERKGAKVAVFAEDDLIALGVLRAARDMKTSVPKDLAVLGFDDLEFSQYMDPRLTTFRQPRLEMGIEGARLIIERNGEKRKKKAARILLKPELVVRDSA